MIGPSIRVTTIRGIEIGVHYSWFIIFFLITLSLTTRFASAHPHWTLAEHYTVGIGTSLLFFASILLHELAHSFVALARGIPVRAITLFVFGGVAQMGREPDRPMTEFQIAIAGPLASALLAGGFGLLSMVTEGRQEHVSALAGWLSSINLVLAVFNLVPGFPLDGGRVLRAILWHVTGNLSKATRIAAGAGQTAGYVFIFFGIWTAFTAQWFSGLWLAFIGWFLLSAAQASVFQVSVRSALSGLTAGDIMTRDCPTIAGRMDVAALVETQVLRSGRRCFLVADGDRLQGLVTLHHVKAVPRDQWDRTPVETIMLPLSRLRTVDVGTRLIEVLTLMEQEDINQVPVTRQDRLVGMITRDHLLRVLTTQMELGGQATSGLGRASATP